LVIRVVARAWEAERGCSISGFPHITHSLDVWWKEVRAKNEGILHADEERLLPYLSAHARQRDEPAVLGVTGDHNRKSLAERHTTTGVTRRRSPEAKAPRPWQIVGIVEDVRQASLDLSAR
jgi:hypothetical protein